MKSYWTITALLSLLLTVGCGDRRNDNRQDYDENKAAPGATAPEKETGAQPNAPAEPSAREGGSAARREREDTRGAAPTTGRSTRSTSRTATAPRGTGTSAPERAERGAESTETANRATPAPRAAAWRELTVPEGTALPLELQTALSSETAHVETPVRARLKQAVRVNGLIALPQDAVLVGEVTEVERAGRVKGRSRLAFTFREVQANNVREDMRTNPITFEGEASKGEDLTKVGAGAIGGAIVGGIAGGGKGAAKGGAIGAAAGTGVVLATRGKDVKLSSGMDIAASLAAPLKIRVPVQ